MPPKMRLKQSTQRPPNKRRRNTVPTPRSFPLPEDVLSEIFDYLKDDIRLSYSLISRDFVSITRKYFFHKFTLDLGRIVSLFNLIESPHCSFAHHVRKLGISRRYQRGIDPVINLNSPNFNGRMAEILRVFPNVTWVCLLGFSTYPSPAGPCETSHVELDRIETLVLKWGNYEGGASFVGGVLSAFRNIRRLECEELAFTTESSPKALELECGLLPELAELSLHDPSLPLVEFLATKLSLKNIQRLSLTSSFMNTYEPANWAPLLNKMRSTPQCFSLELSKTLAGTQESWKICDSGFKNIHTLIFSTKTLLRGPSSDISWIPEAMHNIKIQYLRRLVFNIGVYTASRYHTPPFLSWWPKDGITSALDNHEFSRHLEEIVVNFRSPGKGTSVLDIREALDPGGRRGWWERGMLKVNIRRGDPMRIHPGL